MDINVIIVGGGKVGGYLAGLLRSQGRNIKLIEMDPDKIERLREELGPEVVIAGNGTDPNVLEAAGIVTMDVVAAVTGSDEVNMIVTSLARFEFSVPRTIARVNNPKNAWLFTPAMGVDVALNQADLMAHLIAEEMSLGDMLTLLQFRKGQFSLIEEKVDPASAAVGRTVRELDLPEQCALVAIIRKGELLLPRPEIVLQPADELFALVHSSRIGQLHAALGASAGL